MERNPYIDVYEKSTDESSKAILLAHGTGHDSLVYLSPQNDDEVGCLCVVTFSFGRFEMHDGRIPSFVNINKEDFDKFQEQVSQIVYLEEITQDVEF